MKMKSFHQFTKLFKIPFWSVLLLGGTLITLFLTSFEQLDHFSVFPFTTTPTNYDWQIPPLPPNINWQIEYVNRENNNDYQLKLKNCQKLDANQLNSMSASGTLYRKNIALADWSEEAKPFLNFYSQLQNNGWVVQTQSGNCEIEAIDMVSPCSQVTGLLKLSNRAIRLIEISIDSKCPGLDEQQQNSFYNTIFVSEPIDLR